MASVRPEVKDRPVARGGGAPLAVAPGGCSAELRRPSGSCMSPPQGAPCGAGERRPPGPKGFC